MINYRYDNYWLELVEDEEGSEILVYDNDRLIRRISLSEEDRSPGKINIPLSNICNMKCLYCSEADYMNKEPQRIDMDFAFSVIAAYLKYTERRSGPKKIQLSFDYGGEPICELESMEKIAGYFREECGKKGLIPVVQITTNGAWKPEMLPRVLKAADEIIVSLDGYKKLHEKYRIHKKERPVFNRVFANAKNLYGLNRLKQISCVVTRDSAKNFEQLIDFFIAEFPGSTVRMNPVIFTGNAVKNDIKRITVGEWKNFINKVTDKSRGRLDIIDCRPEKSIKTKYFYGCGYMDMTGWFAWLDGKVTCCTDRELDDFVIGEFRDKGLIMNEELMIKLHTENNVLNINTCESCIAKFYCAGGCPKFRNGLINCDRRKEKYVGMLIGKE